MVVYFHLSSCFFSQSSALVAGESFLHNPPNVAMSGE